MASDTKQSPGASAYTLLALLTAINVILIAGSLQWPMPNDAGVFHFAASQFLQGAVPYRDLVEMNQPLIYWLHEGILLLGGAGDATFRIFDLLCTALVAISVFVFCASAGTFAGLIGAAFLVMMHLTFGMGSAGQRDFFMLIPLLAAAVISVRSAEAGKRAGLTFLLSGALIGVACLIKPTAALAAIIPFAAAGRLRVRDVAFFAVGGLLIATPAAIQLLTNGGLQALLAIWSEHGLIYSQLEAQPVWKLALTLLSWCLRLSGFVLAAAIAFKFQANPRMRAALALAVFGAAHILVQRKGYYYHAYPLICGIVLAGTIGLPRLQKSAAFACILMISAFTAWRAAPPIVHGLARSENENTSLATAAMERALSQHFARGSKVQVLDSDSGGFLAMARVGMKQATPHIYWFLVLNRDEAFRNGFIARLQEAQPDGFLITESQWPVGRGFEGFERFSELMRFVDDSYKEVESESGWRIYKRKPII